LRIEDRYLVRQCQKGNRDALRRIYEKHRDYLLIVAVALSHDTHLAEDAVQDTFVAFAQNVALFRLTGSLRAYLAACAANRVRDLRRAQRRSQEHLPDGPSAASDEPGLTVAANEELERLSRALARLPEEQREVIVLRVHGRLRFRAIAAMQDASVNTVKGRYRYGIQKLRSILDSEDLP
jgi:RNA polymerase sigma-70 factor (ECF subfamily)